MTNAPNLNRRLQLEGPLDVADGGGGRTRQWVGLGSVWGAIEALSGDEALIGGRAADRLTHRITLRHADHGAPSRPRASQRFRLGPRIFDIRAVFEADGDARYLTCLVTEGNAP